MVNLVECFLHWAELCDELLGSLFMAVVDELKVHVHEDRVQDEGQLVTVEVERALDESLKVLKSESKHKIMMIILFS